MILTILLPYFTLAFSLHGPPNGAAHEKSTGKIVQQNRQDGVARLFFSLTFFS
jgi:hypothetical protein